jgi:myo-inositol-1(or 4)-monophosphatase
VLTAQGQRSSASDWNWIIDPLDGTTNFVHGLPFFAVAIGLTWRSVPVVGVVHAPVLGETFSAAHGLGATCNGAPIRVSRTSEMADALLATGFAYTRDQAGAVDNLERLRRVMPHVRDIRRCGSAELDLCYVARGSFDAYWEYGLAPYDVAAGAVIVREAGGVVTDIEGGDSWLFGGQVVASNGALHEAVRRHLP